MSPLLRSFIALSTLALASPGCHDNTAKAELPAEEGPVVTPVRAVRPLTALLSSDAQVVGSVRSKNMVTLSAKQTGQIVNLNVEVGDRVKKNQVLVQLDNSNIAAALSSAKAAERLAEVNQRHARTELTRAQALHASGAINDAAMDGATTQFDAASAQVEQARAAVRSSQQMIADSTVRAPFDGIVSARFASQGELATAMPPSRLLTIVDPDSLEVRISMPEPLVQFVRIGDTLEGHVSPSEKPIEVRITTMSSAVDERSRTVEVLADVVSSGAGNLLVGMLVTLDASGSKTSKASPGPFLPSAAVRNDDKGQYVLVVKEGKLERVDVEAKPLNPGIMAVPKGIAKDALVAIDETSALSPGDHVRVLDNGSTGG